MEPLGSVLISILGAMILLCVAFGFLGACFLLGSFSMLVFEYLLWMGKRVYRQGHAAIEQLHGELNEREHV